MGPSGIVIFDPGGDRAGQLVHTVGSKSVSHPEGTGTKCPRPDADLMSAQPAKDRAVCNLCVLLRPGVIPRHRHSKTESGHENAQPFYNRFLTTVVVPSLT